MNYKRWLDENVGDLGGKLFIVTGASGTLGKATVRHLLRQNAAVIMAVRNTKKCESIVGELLTDFPRAFIKVLRLDLADFQSVDEFCAEVLEEYNYIDGLINLAGVFRLPAKKTADGFDTHYQVNYLAPLQLTDRLATLLKGGRTVFVSSISQNFARVDTEDVESDKVKGRMKVYARSKRLLNEGVGKMQEYYPRMKLNLAHPGVCSTELFSEKAGYSPFFAKIAAFGTRVVFSSPDKCALSIVYAAVKDVGRGKWVHPRFFGIWGTPKVTVYKK